MQQTTWKSSGERHSGDSAMEPRVEEVSGVAPNIGAAYEITVYGTDGKVRQVIKDDAKCYVQNFLRMFNYFFKNSLYYSMGMTSYYTTLVNSNFKNLAGSIISSAGYFNWNATGSFIAVAGAGDITAGVVVGSGSTVVTNDDYKLATIITHGSGSGQLFYDEITFPPIITVGNTVTIPVKRVIQNTSSGAVTIQEIGLYVRGQSTIMILRDILSPQVVLNPGELVAIVYNQIING